MAVIWENFVTIVTFFSLHTETIERTSSTSVKISPSYNSGLSLEKCDNHHEYFLNICHCLIYSAKKSRVVLVDTHKRLR